MPPGESTAPGPHAREASVAAVAAGARGIAVLRRRLNKVEGIVKNTRLQPLDKRIKGFSKSTGKAEAGSHRPTSVTVIAWCIHVSCVLVLVQGIWTMFDPFAQEMMKTVRAPVQVQYAMMFAGFIVSALCGIMMLRGRGGARSLWVAWTGVGMLVGLVIAPMPAVIIPGAILFLVAAFFLYRPVVSAYFSPPGEKASAYDS